MKVQIISRKKELEEKGLFFFYVYHAFKNPDGSYTVLVRGEEIHVEAEFVEPWDEHYW